MRRSGFGLIALMVLVALQYAPGQSFVPPANANDTAPLPPGMPRYDYRWHNLGSGYNPLGLEATPRSLNLRLPSNTGLTRPIYGYRPPPVFTYNPPVSSSSSALQEQFRLPSLIQQPTEMAPRVTGRTRFMEYYGPRTSMRNVRPYGEPTQPTLPVPVSPIGPTEPLDRSESPYRDMLSAAGAPLLELPRLPWEAPTEPGYETEQQAPGPMGQPVPPRAEDRGMRVLPKGVAAPEGTPGATVPPGNLLRPLVPQEGAPAPSPAEAAPAGQPPTGAVAPRRSGANPAEIVNTAAKRYLDRAQAQLKAGQYALAAGSYELARVVLPRNPIPLLGRTVALLATGELSSSANSLLLAIEQRPEPAVFRQDIKAMVPDQELIRSRITQMRADLKRYEDFRLRFLLGYAEYCMGEETVGLINMTQAAHQMPAERPAARQVLEKLRQEAATRPAAATTNPAPGQ